jgi:predicted nuclease of predicted toxin-antitoxin system
MQLLLDEQISDAVAHGFSRRNRSVIIKTVADLGLRAASDREIMEDCARLGFTLVTFDLATIPPLLQEWAEAGRSHAGVILIDERTMATSDFGSIIEALLSIVRQTAHDSWIDRVIYLPNPKKHH